MMHKRLIIIKFLGINDLLHIPCMNEDLNSLGVRDFSDTSLSCILYAVSIDVKTENCSP